MRKKILFIVNPISGGKEKLRLPEQISAGIDLEKFDPKIVFTDHRGHASEIAKQFTSENKDDIIVAVGGDGTVNEVATTLVGTNIPLGIIPLGSGNGLARSLKIPMNVHAALQVITQNNHSPIDVGILNGKYFFNMAGIGFDAHISNQFANMKERGFKSYIRSTFKEWNQYQSQNYQVDIDGLRIQHQSLMISIANSSQYGNNAHIAPQADLQDGLMDVCLVSPFKIYMLPFLAIRMMTKTTHHSSYIKIIKGKEIRIQREKEDMIHLDGEPGMDQKEIHIQIKNKALLVLTPLAK